MLKRDLVTAADIQQGIDAMCLFKHFGFELGKHQYVHALTNVTGFGLLGHLLEMCEGASLSANKLQQGAFIAGCKRFVRQVRLCR